MALASLWVIPEKPPVAMSSLELVNRALPLPLPLFEPEPPPEPTPVRPAPASQKKRAEKKKSSPPTKSASSPTKKPVAPQAVASHAVPKSETRQSPPVPEERRKPQAPVEALQSFYPDAYVAKRLNGEVLLRLFVEGGSGKVTAVKVELPSPFPLFNEAAKEAVLSMMPVLSPNLPPEVLLPVRFRYSR